MKPHAEDDNRPSLQYRDIDSYFRSELSKPQELIDNLIKRVETLPRVDKDGGSDCPFAERLYAQKDDAAQKLAQEIDELKQKVKVIEQEIARCSRNLHQISRGARALHRHEPQTYLAAANNAQIAQYQRAVQQRQLLLKMIEKAEQALKKARARQYPGGEPERQRAYPAPSVSPATGQEKFGPVSLPGLPGALNVTGHGTNSGPPIGTHIFFPTEHGSGKK